jgi:hypothetical protein
MKKSVIRLGSAEEVSRCEEEQARSCVWTQTLGVRKSVNSKRLIYSVVFTNQDPHSTPTEHPPPTTLMMLPSGAGSRSPCFSQMEQMLLKNPGTA